MKKSLIVLLAAMLLAVIAAFTLNLGFLKGFLEQRLSQSTGLEVTIPGKLELRLGTEVRVSASEVSVRNPSWEGEKQVAKIQGLKVNARLSELLSDTVRVRSLDIDRLDLSLEQDARSMGNWTSSRAGGEQTSGAPLQVDALNIASGSGSLRSPRLDAPLQWEIGSLRQEISGDDSMLLVFDGSIGNKATRMELSGGPWSSVIRDGSANFALDIRLGQVALKGDAAFDQLWSPHRPQLQVTLSGPDVTELTDVLGIQGLGRGPLALEVNTRDQDGHLQFETKGTVGELRIDSNGHADSVSSLTRATVDMQIAGPNFGRLARLAGFNDWPESRFDARLKASLDHPGLDIQQLDLALSGARASISGNIPRLPGISGAEIELTASGPALAPFAAVAGLDEVPTGPFSVKGRVSSSDSNTQVDLKYETTLANGSVTGTIGAGQNFEGSELEITAGRSSAAELGQSLGVAGLPSAPWQFRTRVDIPDSRVYQLRETNFRTSGLSFDMSGKLGRESLRRDSDVRFEMTAARLADLQAIAGDTIKLPAQPFKAGGRVEAVADGWRLEQVVANIGEDRIQVDGVLGGDEGLTGTRLSVTGSGRNAARFLPEGLALRLPAGAYELTGKVAVQEGRVMVSESAFNGGPLSVRGSADIPWPLNRESGQFDITVNSTDITALIARVGSLELDSNRLDVRAKGSWRDGRVQVEAGEVKAGQTSLAVQGVFDMPPGLDATNLKVSASSPDLSALGTVSGQRWKPAALSIDTAFTGSRNKLTMSRFEGRLGDSAVDGSFAIDFEPQVPDFDLKLGSARLDLRPFMAGKDTGEEKGVSGEPVIPDVAFPMASLAGAQGRFEIRAGSLLMDNMTLQDIVLRGTLKSGALDISELSTAGYRGRLTATLQLIPLAEGKGRLSASLASQGLVFNLKDQPVEEKERLPAFDIDVSITGDGTGLRQAAAGMNGKIMIGSEGGHIPNRKAKSASGLFLAEVVSTISPSAAKQDQIQISCFATAADIRNGMVMLDPGVAVQSEKLNMFMTGRINLADEKLDANLRTETRKTIDVSASELVSPYVKLSGSLSKPSLKIDPKGTLLSGGAAYLSGGLSLLAKKALDQIGGTGNPCDGYLETKTAEKQP